MLLGVTADYMIGSGGPTVFNTKFMIVGWDTFNSDALILVSEDGVNWQYRNPSPGNSDNLYGVAHDPISGRWVTVGLGGVSNAAIVHYSDDNGNTWTSIDPGAGSGSQMNGVCWTGSRFVAVGKYTTLPLVMVSATGTTWTAKTPAPNTAATLNRIAGSTSLLVAGGSALRLMTSVDNGDTWTSRTAAMGASAVLDAAVKDDTSGLIAVICGEGNGNVTHIASSPTGATWTARTSDPATGIYLNGVVWNGTHFIIVGRDFATGSVPKVMTSPTGTTWTAKSNPVSDFFPLAVGAASDGAIVACGTDSATQDPRIMLSSDDGQTWTQVFPPNLEIEPGNPGPYWMNLQHVAGV